jgi:phenol 2-monooxygenase (NADPH)
VNEGYWVNEVAFWRPDPQDRTKITRTGRIQDVEEGLSEMPHVIVNQARMLAYLLDHMERSASKLRPFYGLHASDVRIDTSGSSDYPVAVTLRHPKDFKRSAKPRRSGRSTSSAATARAAAPGRRSAANCAGTR